MFLVDPVAAVATLAAADRAGCDQAVLSDLVAVSLQIRAWLDGCDADLAIRAGQLAEPAASVMTAGGRRRCRDAEAIVERGAICVAMPELHDALAAGVVSAGHVDAVARAADRLDDTERASLVELAPALVDAATSAASVEAFERDTRRLAQLLSADQGIGQHERLRRQRSLRRWVDRAGLHHTHVTLDAESDAKLAAALDAAVAAERSKPDQSRTFEQVKADAFVALTTSARTTTRHHGEVLVLVDHDTLLEGLHAHSVCETGDGHELPPDTVRRMCCDADIIPVVLDAAGVTLDVGRSRRVATADQRRALRAMYRSCGFPGCDVRFSDCEIHHVIEWIRQRGPTDLDNLVPLCSRHHHHVHEGGWHLSLHPDRTIMVRRPDGSIHTNDSTVDVAPTGVRTEPTELQRLLEASVDAAINRMRRVA